MDAVCERNLEEKSISDLKVTEGDYWVLSVSFLYGDGLGIRVYM